MNKDDLEGKAKEMEGKLTGDESREWEGKSQDAVGGVKEKADDARDRATGAWEGTKEALSGDDDADRERA